MKHNWEKFISEQSRTAPPSSTATSETGKKSVRSICALPEISVLSVHGEDAATFLQGQITCNILDLDDLSACGGAFCNPKGRVISSFTLICRESGTRYWMIFPTSLTAIAKMKLRKYVLRSKVIIDDLSDTLCVCGLQIDPARSGSVPVSLPQTRDRICDNQGLTTLQVETGRWLMIGEFAQIREHWERLVSEHGTRVVSSDYWKLCDVRAGLPVLNRQTSELFVPQMLNLDSLGYISFKKGCYTGQEIVARMHYLGKLKRRMYLAESPLDPSIQPAEPVYAGDNDTPVGQVVNTAPDIDRLYVLVVLQIDHSESSQLSFSNKGDRNLNILELPYTSGNSD